MSDKEKQQAPSDEEMTAVHQAKQTQKKTVSAETSDKCLMRGPKD